MQQYAGELFEAPIATPPSHGCIENEHLVQVILGDAEYHIFLGLVGTGT